MSKAWLVRPYPHHHDISRMSEFLANNFFAIGWPHIGSLANQSREQIKRILEGNPYNLRSLQLGNAYATIDIVVNQMNIGDLVLLPDGDDIYFAKITSDYQYDPAKDNDSEGYPHQRKVSWLHGPISRSQLPDNLRNSLKVHRTTADLSRHYDIIKALSEGISPNSVLAETSADEIMEVEYPVRPGVLAKILIPKNINQIEASRLGDFVKTLYFE